MSLLAYKRQVLNILAENLKNAQPQVVDSCKIAERLDMGLKETCQLIKVMNKMGIVESDQEGQRSLITRDGLHFLDAFSFSRAA
jgi:predicted transcriptional regulator